MMASTATTERPSASHYSRYDDDGLDSDEEEEERRLSEEHGEAADESGTKRKRSSNNNANETTLTEEDAAAAKQFEEEVRAKAKKARPALKPSDLKSAKGLIYIRRSFPTQVQKYRHVPFSNKVRGAGIKSNKLAQKMNTNTQINAAASYSRSLMTAYREFANEIFPSLAAEDTFLKIEDLGSKKEIKDYLQLMRDEFRKDYLDGIYGIEKTGRILNEMEYGLKVHHQVQDEENYLDSSSARMLPRLGYAAGAEYSEGEEGGNGAETPPASPPAEAVANPYTCSSKKAETGEDRNNVTEAAKEEEDDEPLPFEDDSNDHDVNKSAEGKGSNEEPIMGNVVEKIAEDTTGDMELEPVGENDKDGEVETEVKEKGVDAVNEEMTVEDQTQDTLTGEVETEVKEKGVDAVNEEMTCEAQTQETLTLKFDDDDDDMEFTQNDRFSQVSAVGGINTEDEAAEPALDVGGGKTQGIDDDDDHFSQNDQFSQDEENTERFSQFTQSVGPIFEEDGDGGEEDEGDVDQLGQTMATQNDTQLSMEY